MGFLGPRHTRAHARIIMHRKKLAIVAGLGSSNRRPFLRTTLLPARGPCETLVCKTTYAEMTFFAGMSLVSDDAAPAQPPETAARKRIVIVDDDPEIIESVRYALESLDLEVLIARDGNQGLALAESQSPDLVILDMMMPKRSGFLVVEKLRRTLPVPVKIIMITANEGSRHKAYADMLGVDEYIRKPFPMDRLLESVKRLLAT